MPNEPYTHFISLPITCVAVQRNIKSFQSRARRSAGLQNAADSSFVNPGSLHITLGMLRLKTPFEVRRASELLMSLSNGINGILGGRALKVHVYGLETMEEDPSAARILYTRVEDIETPERLNRMCAFVREAFKDAGYIDEERELKLHMTVVRANKPSRGAGPQNAASGNARRPRFTVDARELLQESGQATFGTCQLEQIQIARRFLFTASGAYANDGILSLP
ncbi:activating signal cointegrator 1 complex subunit [Coemansia sp. RSA 1933]|nr:activating signal cointegrator 1 complex subunit [Coemansia sp. RSA 1933]